MVKRVTLESIFQNYLKKMNENYGQVGLWDVPQDCVKQYVIENDLKTLLKNKRLGEHWFLNFKKRHKLYIKSPQSVEYLRNKMTDPFIVNFYFDLMHTTLHSLDLLENPERSYAQILQNQNCEWGCRKESITCLNAVSAAGSKAPPLIIFGFLTQLKVRSRTLEWFMQLALMIG